MTSVSSNKDCLVGWLVGWLLMVGGWLFGCLLGARLGGCMAACLLGWLAFWLAFLLALGLVLVAWCWWGCGGAWGRISGNLGELLVDLFGVGAGQF